MRRTVLLIAVVGLLTSATAAPAFAGKTWQKTNPHFVPNSFSGFSDPGSGIVTLRYTVAGLGKNGSGYIVAKGEVSISARCYKNNGTYIDNFVDHDVRVNEHYVFSGSSGNDFNGTDQLRPSAVCPNGTTIGGVPGSPYPGPAPSYQWSNVDITLYSDQSKALTYDYYCYNVVGGACY